MKSFSERNPFIIGAIGAAITLGLVVFSLNYQKIPIFNENNDYSAYFAEAGGLTPGAAVRRGWVLKNRPSCACSTSRPSSRTGR